MDVNDQIHAQLVKAGVRLAASLPDDWVNTLIRRISAKDNEIRHVRVGREAETIAICAGAFFGGVRSVAIWAIPDCSPAPARWRRFAFAT